MTEVARVTERTVGQISDALELAFHGIDFEPMPIDAEDKIIISGSWRYKAAFDPEAGCDVHVVEVHALADRYGKAEGDHRLVVWWDNDESEEYSVDDQAVLVDNPEESESACEESSKKIMQALRAIIADAA